MEKHCSKDKYFGIDPDEIPMPVKIGVAPAMGADPRAPFWAGREGTAVLTGTSSCTSSLTEQQKLIVTSQRF